MVRKTRTARGMAAIPRGAIKQVRNLRKMKVRLTKDLKRTAEKAKNVDRRLKQYTRKYPHRALMIATAVGIATGAAVMAARRRSRRKKRR